MSASTIPTLRPMPRQRDREIGGQRRFADPALARSDRDRCAALDGARRHSLSAISATRTSRTPSAHRAKYRARRSPAGRAPGASSPAGIEDQGRHPVGQPQRLQPVQRHRRECGCLRMSSSLIAALLAEARRGVAGKICAFQPLLFTHFVPISECMERLGGFFDRIALAMAGKRSPWGGAAGTAAAIRR